MLKRNNALLGAPFVSECIYTSSVYSYVCIYVYVIYTFLPVLDMQCTWLFDKYTPSRYFVNVISPFIREEMYNFSFTSTSITFHFHVCYRLWLKQWYRLNCKHDELRNDLCDIEQISKYFAESNPISKVQIFKSNTSLIECKAPKKTAGDLSSNEKIYPGNKNP